MHELAIASEVLSAAGAALEKHGCRLARRLSLRVGELSGVNLESLRFCLETVSKGTALEGAKIELACAPCRVRCRACGAERERSARSAWPCPACESRDMEIVGGRELEVTSMEAE